MKLMSLVALASLLGAHSTSPRAGTSPAPFTMTLAHNGNTWSATCANGCKWDAVSVTCRAACAMIVDDRGMRTAASGRSMMKRSPSGSKRTDRAGARRPTPAPRGSRSGIAAICRGVARRSLSSVSPVRDPSAGRTTTRRRTTLRIGRRQARSPSASVHHCDLQTSVVNRSRGRHTRRAWDSRFDVQWPLARIVRQRPRPRPHFNRLRAVRTFVRHRDRVLPGSHEVSRPHRPLKIRSHITRGP